MPCFLLAAATHPSPKSFVDSLAHPKIIFDRPRPRDKQSQSSNTNASTNSSLLDEVHIFGDRHGGRIFSRLLFFLMMSHSMRTRNGLAASWDHPLPHTPRIRHPCLECRPTFGLNPDIDLGISVPPYVPWP